MKRLTAVFLLVVSLLSFPSCASEPYTVTEYGLFDTTVTVRCYGAPYAAADFVYERLREFHRLTDIYHTYGEQHNLCYVNENAAKEPIQITSDLFDFLAFTYDMAVATGGAVDPTLGALTSLWKAAGDIDNPMPPAPAQIAEALTHTGYEKMILDRDEKTVFFTDEKLKLDVGAFAKGYAVEQAANLGYTGYLIDAGGNIRAVGDKFGDAFRIGVRSPYANEELTAVFPLTDAACVTSGTSYRYFVSDGVVYHHLLDPIDGYPANYYLSLTVIHSDSGVADALATALFVLPEEEHENILEAFPDARVGFVRADGTRGGIFNKAAEN